MRFNLFLDSNVGDNPTRQVNINESLFGMLSYFNKIKLIFNIFMIFE
jgi:hypothetical protein